MLVKYSYDVPRIFMSDKPRHSTRGSYLTYNNQRTEAIKWALGKLSSESTEMSKDENDSRLFHNQLPAAMRMCFDNISEV